MPYPKNLNEFYTELKNNGVKLTHQFQLSIVGTGIDSVDKALENLTMWVQGAQVPGRTQNVADLPYLGYTFNVPTNMIMTNEMTVTINADQQLKIHDAIIFWAGTISDPDIDGGAAGGGIKTASTATGRMDLFNDKMDTVLHTFKLVGIYPAEIGVIEFTNADPEIATFDVTFRYQYWKTELTPNSF